MSQELNQLVKEPEPGSKAGIVIGIGIAIGIDASIDSNQKHTIWVESEVLRLSTMPLM